MGFDPARTDGYRAVVKILVVEDDKKLGGFLRKGLEAQGFIVDFSSDGDEGYTLATTREYDALVLDIMLPGRDGLSILRNLRDRQSAVPILLLTARSALNERLDGLNLGADDYLTKPFEFAEFEARVGVLAKRVRPGAYRGGTASVALDPERRALLLDGARIELTLREFDIVEILLKNAGAVMSREQLASQLAVGKEELTDNLFQVHISRLRKKLGRGAVRISTVRGSGYVLQVESPED